VERVSDLQSRILENSFEKLSIRIEKILQKLGINPDSNNFKFLPFPEANVPACYVPALNEIWIDPNKLLNYSDDQLAHVIYHEALHAGLAIVGHKILDESLTDLITELKIRKEYPYTEFRSGYSDIVDDLISFLPNVSFEELESMIEDEEIGNFDFETILFKLATAEIFNLEETEFSEESVKFLSEEYINRKLRYRWIEIVQLFPRLGWKFLGKDPLENPEVLHSPVSLPLSDSIISRILERVVSKLLNEPTLLLKLNQYIINYAILNKMTFKGTLELLDLGYLRQIWEEQ